MTSHNSLPALPLELWDFISSHLTNADIKSVRLACKQFSNAASLCFERVFISANPLNIEVFRAIADHDRFRHTVAEIVWDDARLARGPQRSLHSFWNGDEWLSEENQDKYVNKKDLCPTWFKRACRENVKGLKYRKGQDVDDRPDHIARAEQIAAQPPLKKCWEYYKGLLQQQKDVLATHSDEDAFVYGLKQFPALKKVTVTPAAHGYLFAPLYPTPMIRAFPKGFNYPIPRGWPMTLEDESAPDAYPWQELDEALKERHHGFRIVTRVLSTEKHNVSELILNTNGICTGINCTIFDNPCDEYENLVTVLKKPGFRHFDIALIVGGIHSEEINWRPFRNGRLRRALGEANDMEDMRLHVAAFKNPARDSIMDWGTGSLRHFIPLQSIFPVEKWSKLRRFELSHFPVVQSDVIGLLAALPETLRYVQLSDLLFLNDSGNWYSLLAEMRNLIHENVLWPNRDTASRTQVTIIIPAFHYRAGYEVWLEKETHDFLYREGEHPFSVSSPETVRKGFGIEKDTFEPNNERPNVNRNVLKEMGYLKRRYEYNPSEDESPSDEYSEEEYF